MNHKTTLKIIIKSFLYFFVGIIIIASISLNRLASWFSQKFSIGIQEVLFTIKSPLQGADTNFLKDAIDFINIQKLIILFGCYVIAVILFECFFTKVVARIEIKTKNNHSISLNVYPMIIVFFSFSVLFLLFTSLYHADKAAHITQYIKEKRSQTLIFDEQYVKPTTANIRGTGKNIIYIYMESMETTYASKEVGGAQQVDNYIPYLTTLAQDNLNFSNSTKLGGFHVSTGATWTMGALFTMSTGVPFKFPINGNEMNLREKFASGITAIGDILEEKGYVQEFLCGSDATFGGRKQFYEQHGKYKIYDLFSAREQGYIDSDYLAGWGFEDEILYRIAKDEILRLAESDKPFNFTMLTVDTHHVGGYKCNLCQDAYSENLANVLACADHQIYDFIQWCQAQDFYNDTVIVIIGDHPRMDSILIGDLSIYDRTVYNCFINSAKTTQNIKNREFCTLDIFPTVLSSMGFEIEGDRLGLGTDLFSNTQTYCEEIGFDEFNMEMS